MDLKGIVFVILAGLGVGIQAVLLVGPTVNWICAARGLDPTDHPTTIKVVVISISVFLVLIECVAWVRLKARSGRPTRA